MRYPPLRSVLLIDDNPNDRLLTRRELAKEFDSLTVHEVINQKELDTALAAGDFELVITDYQLGWSNGLRVLRAVNNQRTSCPVIMFTNTGTQEIAVEAMKSGLNDYVIKSPQHFIRLCQSVRSVWQQFHIQLRASQLELRLQALLQQLEVGIFRATPTGALLDANIAMLNMLGVESVEAARSVLDTRLKMAFREENPSTAAELVLERSDRPPLWIKVSATSNEINGELIVDGIAENITDRKRAEQRLNQLNQTLEEKVHQRTQQLETTNRELEMFAYSISHDLRSPIRQIDGFVNLIQEHFKANEQKGELDDKAEHYLSVISELTGQSGTMIDALLEFSKTGRVEMRVEPVDMERMVRKMNLKMSENKSAQANKQTENQASNQSNDQPVDNTVIEWRIEPLPTVVCDRSLIQLVWQNLLENAIKFTQQRPHPIITIQAQMQPKEIIFSVQDNGIGFEPDEAENIFDMFQSAHSRKTVEGIGIGLANVKRIIARHSGRVWAEGDVDKGATLFFSLPHSPP